MKEITREEFLKTSTLAVAAAFFSNNLFGKSTAVGGLSDELMLTRLVNANDRSVKRILENSASAPLIQYYRGISANFSILTAAFSHPKSSYFRSSDVRKAMNDSIDKLQSLQYSNGTLDAGGNRKSPPDTAFILEALYPSALILRANESEENSTLKSKLEDFLLAAAEGIIKGGVHTPNHRWEISSILCKLYHLFGDNKYVERVEEWLAEGVYQNADGNYPERSRNYAAVENQAFVTIGSLLNRPEFFKIVSKNLNATYYYMEAGGELVCLDSRRQDQFKPISILRSYLTYRYMAIHEDNSFYAAIAKEMEGFEAFESQVLSTALPHFMASPLLLKELPKGEELPSSYNKYFKESDLVRIKRGTMTASIFGGNDLPLRVASGRSCNPTFFRFRKGKAILEYARLSTSFFNTGYVRSDGLEKDGNKYLLQEKKEAYYYQPLPGKKINKAGDYKLSESLDRRFWSKMDFAARPKDTLTLASKIMIEEMEDGFKIDIEVSGPDNVEVTLDLCFRDGGNFEGAIQGEEQGAFFLEDGFAKYAFGSDTIEVGPGKYEHGNINSLDGEVYSTHFGTIKGKGQHLYICGLVPFKHSLTIK